MSFISYALRGNYRRYFKKLKVIAIEEDKSYLYLTYDTIRSVIKYGIGLSDYLNYKFYERNIEERKEYVGIKLQDKFYEKVSPSQYKKRYTVKPLFLKEFKEYTKRAFCYPKDDSYAKFLKFTNKNKVFVEKPIDGSGGSGVKKVFLKNIPNLKEYYNYLKTNNCFIEELIIQHPDLSKLCKESINTIRIMTFNDQGNPTILWAGLRIGNGINAVDNFHESGMGCAIDLDTGKLTSNAYDKDGKIFKQHPKTGITFKGFQIPYFKEAIAMTKKAALESDKIKVVGWDVAISPNGPVIIEGNRRPGFDLVQVLSERGRMDIINYVLERIDK